MGGRIGRGAFVAVGCGAWGGGPPPQGGSGEFISHIKRAFSEEFGVQTMLFFVVKNINKYKHKSAC